MEETKEKDVSKTGESIDMIAEMEAFEKSGVVSQEKLDAYWKENRNLVLVLLAIWAGASYGIQLLGSALNSIVIGGFPLAYYMGAQGSLIIFMILIYVYAKKMGELDKKYNVQEEEE